MSELTPITRKEHFLAKAGGQSVETPTPITREETFLQAIIDNGSGGGGGGGGALLKVGVTVEDGTATMDKTWTEINTAFNSGLAFALIPNEEEQATYLYLVNMVGVAEAVGMYGVGLRNIEMNTSSFFMASSADGYPVMSQ